MIPHVEIVRERCGSSIVRSEVRPATEDDIAKAQTTHDQGACNHSVVVDQSGFGYTFRNCFVCRAGLGAL